jgi:pyrroline-5-carboxylate reductase
MKIGFIGTGKIAEPMIKSLVRRFPNSEVSISQRTKTVSDRLNTEFDNVTVGENQWILNNSDIVVLSVLADVARAELPDLTFQSHQKVISVMADISLEEVGQLIAPAKNACVTIPLPFIETGGCPLPVFPHAELLTDLFGDENNIILLTQEDHMGPHFATTAILSTLMAQLHTTGKWLGDLTNNSANGEIYVASLVSGYLGSLNQDGNERFLEAMKDLSTEGGLNTQLLNHNRDAGMLETLNQGLDDLDARLRKST